jgi:hypothetical protein
MTRSRLRQCISQLNVIDEETIGTAQQRRYSTLQATSKVYFVSLRMPSCSVRTRHFVRRRVRCDRFGKRLDIVYSIIYFFSPWSVILVCLLGLRPFGGDYELLRFLVRMNYDQFEGLCCLREFREHFNQILGIIESSFENGDLLSVGLAIGVRNH